MFTESSSPEDYLRHAGQHVMETSGTVTKFEDLELRVPSEQEVSDNPGFWLQYCAGVAANKNSYAYLWNSIFSTLENWYSTFFAQLVSSYSIEKNLSVAKAEYKARAVLASLREARVIAENRARKYMCEYHAAHNAYQVVSRMITARGDELRSLRG